MRNLLKEILVTGLGTLVLTKEKAEELVDKLIQQGEISKKEGRELLDEFLEKTEDRTADFSDKVSEKIKNRLQESGFVTEEEIKGLRQKVDNLEQKLADIEKDIDTKG